MPDAMSALKARLLIYLSEMEQPDCTVTHLADLFCVAKSTVSRAADWCERNDMLKRGSDRKIHLTAHGIQLAHLYKQRRENFLKWLVSEGVSLKSAERDSLQFALACSEESAALMQKFAQMQHIRECFAGKTHLGGREFCTALQDGHYPIPFVFYRCACQDEYCICPSMANEGFEHPGELNIRNGNGLIVLKAKPVEQLSLLGGLKVQGILHNLKYQDGRHFKEAGKDGTFFSFPASALRFLHVGAESFFQGSAILKMSCSAGLVHMPESTAIFTMFL